MPQLTIAAINLQSGVATTKGNWQYALTGWKYWLPHSDQPIGQAGKMLKEEGVDVACISEISEKSLCTGWRSQTETLAENAKIEHAHFFSQQKIGRSLRHEGNAIVSCHPISSFVSHPLHRELIHVAFDEAVIEAEGRKISVFAVHLALTKKRRDIQIRQIAEVLKKKDGLLILAGDFNERDPAALDILLKETSLKHRCTLPTYPSWKPKYPLDYVFLSEDFGALDCYIPKSPIFSDHAALIVRAELK